MNKFVFWGESQDLYITHVQNRKEAKNHSEDRNKAQHPFSTPGKKLKELTRHFLSGNYLFRSPIIDIDIQVPAVNQVKENYAKNQGNWKPLGSPTLQNSISWEEKKKNEEKKEKSSQLGLEYFRIQALEVPSTFIVDNLKRAEDHKKIIRCPKNVQFGETVRFWRETILVGLSLLIKNKYLPQITRIDEIPLDNLGKFVVSWAPHRSKRYDYLLSRLAEKIPPICMTPIRGVKYRESEILEEEKRYYEEQARINEPKSLISNFFACFIDDYVRELFNSHKSQISKEFVIDKMLTQGMRHRSSMDQKMLIKLANALFSRKMKVVELLQNTADRYKSYLNITEPRNDRNWDASFHTCLKIIPPDLGESTINEVGIKTQSLENQKTAQDSAPWKIELYVQSKIDPSTIVSVHQLKRRAYDPSVFNKEDVENIRDRLRKSLKRITQQHPSVRRLLSQENLDSTNISLTDAFSLIRSSKSLSKYQDIKVVVPTNLRRASSELTLQYNMKVKKKQMDQLIGKGKKREKEALDFQSLNQGTLNAQSIVEYDWKVAIGNQDLTVRELKRLVKLKVPLLKIRGNWVELNDKNLRQVQNVLQKYAALDTIDEKAPSRTKIELEYGFSGKMSFSRALKAKRDLESDVKGYPNVQINTQGEFKSLIDTFEDPQNMPNITEIPHFQGSLRPYQLRGVSWLLFMKKLGMGACLADDMGLGKTIQVIAYLLYSKYKLNKKPEFKCRALIVCPLSVLGNWKREINRFAPDLKIFVHHGSSRINQQQEIIDDHSASVVDPFDYDVVLTTYTLGLLDKEVFQGRKRGRIWNLLVLDESQNVKNYRAKRTKAIRKIDAHHRIALTGTPIENRLSELWSIMEILNSGYLGPIQRFKREYARPIERHGNETKSKELKRTIKPFILRRVKTDKTIGLELPEKREMTIYCPLTKEQASLYEAIVQEMLEKIEESQGIQRKGLILSTLTKLKQVCNHPAQFLHSNGKLGDRSGKLTRLDEMVSEALSEGDKVLVFTQYREMGNIIQKYLRNRLRIKVPFLHGGVSQKKRDDMISDFQTKAHSHPVFVVSLRAGGTGLNLTAASNVFHFDRWWNPAVENQATDRAYRIGQRKDVNVYKFACMGTVEEKIIQIIESKKKLANTIIGAGDSWISDLNTEKLKSFLSLRKEDAML